MNHRLNPFAAVLLAIVVSTACSTTAERRQMEQHELAIYQKHAGAPIDQIRTFRMLSWQPVSDYTLLLESRINDWYLIEVDGPCMGLPFAHVIGVESSFSGTLQARFDSIIVDRMPCRIRSIRPVDAKAAREELRASDA